MLAPEQKTETNIIMILGVAIDSVRRKRSTTSPKWERSGHGFRSKKEVYNFSQMGEVPRYKLKPKSEESNVVVHSVVVLRVLCWFSSGGGSNQQPIPSNIEGLETIFNLEKKAARRTHQAEKDREEK
ncbi:hypothetical protein CKAN_02434400 [Cinnamomum micranthum f. kanehirae]|uniref:Uncharacterized protein n=1 Tax=Cinnamomum micranthum f. kanehirae TaxID=337451 RepID=A0A443PWA2_9MAGN|nr:hypothetical protein CKAN_02434400 [Cinnamomum micranthum f. kanehirae]